jgi:hypothetical protein
MLTPTLFGIANVEEMIPEGAVSNQAFHISGTIKISTSVSDCSLIAIALSFGF